MEIDIKIEDFFTEYFSIKKEVMKIFDFEYSKSSFSFLLPNGFRYKLYFLVKEAKEDETFIFDLNIIKIKENTEEILKDVIFEKLNSESLINVILSIFIKTLIKEKLTTYISLSSASGLNKNMMYFYLTKFETTDNINTLLLSGIGEDNDIEQTWTITQPYSNIEEIKTFLKPGMIVLFSKNKILFLNNFSI